MTKALPYQRQGVDYIEKFNGRALLADEMGLGKTFQSLLWMVERGIKLTIVVCPAFLKYNWEREAKLHFKLRSEVIEGTAVPVGPRFHTPHSLVIINYDILRHWHKWLRKLKPQLIIIDECHFIGNPKAKRTKAVKALCKGVPHVICLSGSPLTNRPAELFPTLSILRRDLFNSFKMYGDRYCAPEWTKWGKVYKGAAHLKELHKKLKRHLMIRRLQEDVLSELPQKRRSIVPLQIKMTEYNAATKDFVNWVRKNLGDRKANKAAKAERLVRMGYLKRLVAREKMTAVIQWLDSMLEESDSKIIVGCIHKAPIAMLRDYYGKRCVVLDGDTKNKQRMKVVDQFQKDKKVRLIITNIYEGWNGTAANKVAVAEFGWTPGKLGQLEKRAHRIGTKKPVNIYYLVTKGTIEEYLCKLLQTKQKVLEATLDGEGSGDQLDIFDELEKQLMKGKK